MLSLNHYLILFLVKLLAYIIEILCSKTRKNSVVKFYDCSNFNRKNGRTCPYNTSKVVHSSHNLHSLFLCRCTHLGNGRYKLNWKHPLRSWLLFPYKALRDIFVYCGLLLYHWWSAHALDNTIIALNKQFIPLLRLHPLPLFLPTVSLLDLLE